MLEYKKTLLSIQQILIINVNGLQWNTKGSTHSQTSNTMYYYLKKLNLRHPPDTRLQKIHDKNTDLIQKYNAEQFILNVYYNIAIFVFRALLSVCF